ncbi:response regulator transcription factor [Streptomyces tanashiensis]
MAAGKSLLDPVATAGVLERLRDGNTAKRDDKLANLTGQERKILDLIGEGLTNRVIGERLHLAEKTIKNYVSNLLSKLGMERRSQAVAYVARLQAERH